MALSGSTSVKVTSWDTLKFAWTATQSIATNKSTISWKMTLTATGSGYINSTKTKKWRVVVNGTAYSGTNKVGISNNSTITLASGTTSVAHSSNGTKTLSWSFTQQFAITFSGNYIESKSGSGSATLDTIPRQVTITSAPNFTDEDSPIITYSNPAGDAVTEAYAAIIVDGANDITYRAIDLSSTSYTFTFTDLEKAKLQNSTIDSNTKSVCFRIKSTVGSTDLFSDLYKTLTIANCTPTISASVSDANTLTTALTGNANKFIKYFSRASCSMAATALKGATITSQSIKNGDATLTSSSGSFNNVESASFIFSVTDSRGNTTATTLSKTLVEYVKLTCTMDVTTPNGEGEATLTVSGKCFSGSFGSVTNSLTVKYRFKTGSGSYGSWVSITPIISGTSYSATVNLTGLDYTNALTFQANAYDSLMDVSSDEKTVKAVPIFDWGPGDFKFNVPFSAPEGTIADLYDKSGTLVRNGLALYENGGIDANTTLDHLILTHINTPNSVYMYVKTEFYSTKSTTSNRMQTAFPYGTGNYAYFRYYYQSSGWTDWKRLNDGWYPGETLTLYNATVGSNTDLSGILSASSTSVVAAIPVGKPIYATSVSVTGKVVIRGVKGYFGQATYSAPLSLSDSSLTVTTKIVSSEAGLIQIKITRSSAFTNTTNNTPVSITCDERNPVILSFS